MKLIKILLWIGLFLGILLQVIAVLSEILNWFSWYWTGIISLILILGCGIALIIMVIRNAEMISPKKEDLKLLKFDEAHKIGLNNFNKDAFLPEKNEHYIEGRLNIGESGSSKVHFIKAKEKDENLFGYQLIDLKDPENKLIFYDKEDIIISKDKQIWFEKLLNLFAEKPKKMVTIERPIIDPLTHQEIAKETEQKEIEELKAEKEKIEEEKEGQA